MDLFENAGAFTPDNLISGDKEGTLVRGISLAPGQGVLKRGTLLFRDENNLGIMFGETETEPGDGTEGESVTAKVIMPSGILTDDADTGNDENGEPVVAEEYITGIFNPDAVIAKEGTDITDYTEALRNLGIFLKEVI